jgi:hypothetical protein
MLLTEQDMKKGSLPRPLLRQRMIDTDVYGTTPARYEIHYCGNRGGNES